MILRNIDYDKSSLAPGEYDPETYQITLKRIDFEDEFRWTFFRLYNIKDKTVKYLYSLEKLNFESLKYEVC